MKLVINACFGGFGLSKAGVMRYAEIKGIKVYPENPDGEMGEALTRMGLLTYWIKPPGERPARLPEPWINNSIEDRKANNAAMDESQISPRDIPRDDPALVRCVEELGDAASGNCAKLAVVEIPDDVSWSIEEYDGNEHVAEAHRTWHT